MSLRLPGQLLAPLLHLSTKKTSSPARFAHESRLAVHVCDTEDYLVEHRVSSFSCTVQYPLQLRLFSEGGKLMHCWRTCSWRRKTRDHTSGFNFQKQSWRSTPGTQLHWVGSRSWSTTFALPFYAPMNLFVEDVGPFILQYLLCTRPKMCSVEHTLGPTDSLQHVAWCHDGKIEAWTVISI